MRTVHESVFKPKLLMAETKFIVDIRPVNRNAAALSSANATAAANNNTLPSPSAVNTANLGHGGMGVGIDVVDGAHRSLNGGSGGVGVGRGSNSHNSRAEVNWRRVFTVSSLIVSLLLISGSIYLHLRQKPHLGRLRHEQSQQQTQQQQQHVSLAGGVASTTEAITSATISAPVASARVPLVAATTSGNSFMTENSGTTATISMVSIDSAPRWNAPSVVMDSRARHITEACMQCICATATECRPATCGNNKDCGVFRISQPYWLDAGKPALEGDESCASNTTTTYTHCVNNIYCATRTVAAYISKYARDCNGDGVIECRDHIALHLLGPSGCAQYEEELSPIYVQRMADCLAG